MPVPAIRAAGWWAVPLQHHECTRKDIPAELSFVINVADGAVEAPGDPLPSLGPFVGNGALTWAGIRCSVRTGHTEHVAVGVAQRHPAKVAHGVLLNFTCTRLDQSRDLTVEVTGGHVEVDAILA